MAGAKIERVIRVHTIGYGRKTTCTRQFIQRGKQFVFAEIATVGRVGAIGGFVPFVRFDELVAQGQVPHKLLDYGLIMSRVTGGRSTYGRSADIQTFRS